ncbi:hypothetical protein HYV49_02450 [Candidatus Pacearchaeota archaeon]|nr:hypothetical protein [Candidatus Pacearchaeota archaeon]
MNEEIPEIDLEFFCWLDSAYRALSLSVQDPVIVPNLDVLADDPKIIERLPIDITRIYFYASDYGEEIVRKRIEDCPDVIWRNYRMHKGMFHSFQRIDKFAKQENRRQVMSYSQSLCEKLSEYGEFVRGHQENLGVKSFLSFPNFKGGVFTYRRPVVIHLPNFNQEKSYEGLINEIDKFTDVMNNFSLEGRLKIHNVYSGLDSGEGHDDGSYRATISLTKMLLKEHLGFDVES